MISNQLNLFVDMDDREAQNDEIMALKSIFDETQIHVGNSGSEIVGCIYVKPEVPENFMVQADKGGCLQQFAVQHVCPIELHFSIPANYPTVNPPNFTLVCKWLRRDQV
jgi:E3 ubiquitin-protein ligase RNF14